jgi:hypothetical protein
MYFAMIGYYPTQRWFEILMKNIRVLLYEKGQVGCEGLELHILHRPHMDSIDLDPQPILGMGSDIY